MYHFSRQARVSVRAYTLLIYNYNYEPILYKGFGFDFLHDLECLVYTLYYSVLTTNPYTYILLHHSRYCSQLKNGGATDKIRTNKRKVIRK